MDAFPCSADRYYLPKPNEAARKEKRVEQLLCIIMERISIDFECHIYELNI